MRSLISLAAALLCLAAIVAAKPASAGLFGRTDAGQCANGQCANGQCDNSQAPELGKHRRPIDVNVDVSPTPVKITVLPAPVNVLPAPVNAPAIPPEKPNGEKAVLLGVLASIVFAVVLLAAILGGFRQRASTKKKS